LLVTQLYPNGTLRANYWNNYSWRGNSDPILQGGSRVLTNFTGVALSTDMRAVVMTNDSEIHQFTVDRTNPLLWTWESQINGTSP
jgi:hypothetical protein